VSDTTDCARIRPELGVYVLGAISPADRAAVDGHLAACRRCRDEVAELAWIPALLRRVPATAAMQLSGDRPDVDLPEAGLLEGLLRPSCRQREGLAWPRPAPSGHGQAVSRATRPAGQGGGNPQRCSRLDGTVAGDSARQKYPSHRYTYRTARRFSPSGRT
jgi:anti-sigma factor RsiW